MNCHFCGSSRLRYSRFRVSDLPYIFLIRLPVRCRNCQARSYIWISQAMAIRRATKLPDEPNKSRKSG